jgi:hypothetical protein
MHAIKRVQAAYCHARCCDVFQILLTAEVLLLPHLLTLVLMLYKYQHEGTEVTECDLCCLRYQLHTLHHEAIHAMIAITV